MLLSALGIVHFFFSYSTIYVVVHLTEVLTCTSQMTNDIKHLYMHIGYLCIFF